MVNIEELGWEQLSLQNLLRKALGDAPNAEGIHSHSESRRHS